MPSNRINYGLFNWDFITCKGFPDLPGRKLKTIQKQGVNGRAFKQMEYDADPTPIYCTALVNTFAQAVQWVADMKNLQGLQVTFYDATGQSYTGVVIESVRHIRTKYVLNPQWGPLSYSSGYKVTHALIMTYPYGSF